MDIDEQSTAMSAFRGTRWLFYQEKMLLDFPPESDSLT